MKTVRKRKTRPARWELFIIDLRRDYCLFDGYGLSYANGVSQFAVRMLGNLCKAGGAVINVSGRVVKHGLQRWKYTQEVSAWLEDTNHFQ